MLAAIAAAEVEMLMTALPGGASAPPEDPSAFEDVLEKTLNAGVPLGALPSDAALHSTPATLPCLPPPARGAAPVSANVANGVLPPSATFSEHPAVVPTINPESSPPFSPPIETTGVAASGRSEALSSPRPIEANHQPVETSTPPSVEPKPATPRVSPGFSVRGEALPGALQHSTLTAPPAPPTPEHPDQHSETADPATKAWRADSVSSNAAAVDVSQPADIAASPVEALDAPADQITKAVLSARKECETAGRTEVHLRLDPPHLGRMHVHLSGDGQHLSGRLVVEEQAAFHLLEGQLQGMRDRLETAGVSVGRLELSWQGGGPGGGWQEPRSAQEPGPAPLPRSPTLPKPAPILTQGKRGRVDLLA
jgi:hypothetical protein